MRGGIWILSVFAAAWAIAGILVAQVPSWWVAIPVAISIGVLLYAARISVSTERATHVGRLIGIWSAAEGVAMFLTANVLINLHRKEAIMPAFAIIVGLHFLPLARGIPVRFYFATGASLIAAGVAGLWAPPQNVALATGWAAAGILWASAFALAKGAR